MRTQSCGGASKFEMPTGKHLRATGGRLFLVILGIIILLFIAAAVRLHNSHSQENVPLVDQGR